eukprot:g3887.t1
MKNIKEDGFDKQEFTLGCDVGTHIDAPSHFIKGGRTIDQLKLDNELATCGAVIDVEEKCRNDSDYQMTVQDLIDFEAKHGRLRENSLVIMKTGFGKWIHTGLQKGKANRYLNPDNDGTRHHPGFSEELAEWLVRERSIAGIGIDCCSLDYGPSTTYPVHNIVLGADVIMMNSLSHDGMTSRRIDQKSRDKGMSATNKKPTSGQKRPSRLSSTKTVNTKQLFEGFFHIIAVPLLILATVAVVFVLSQGRAIFVPLIISIGICYLLRPLIDFIQTPFRFWCQCPCFLYNNEYYRAYKRMNHSHVDEMGRPKSRNSPGRHHHQRLRNSSGELVDRARRHVRKILSPSSLSQRTGGGSYGRRSAGRLKQRGQSQTNNAYTQLYSEYPDDHDEYGLDGSVIENEYEYGMENMMERDTDLMETNGNTIELVELGAGGHHDPNEDRRPRRQTSKWHGIELRTDEEINDFIALRCCFCKFVRCPRLFAVLVTILFALGILTGLAILSANAIHQFENQHLAEYENQAKVLLNQTMGWAKNSFGIDPETLLETIKEEFPVANVVKSALKFLADTVTDLFFIFLFVLYILFDNTTHAQLLEARIDDGIMKYIVVKTVLSAGVGLFTFVILGPCLSIPLAYIFGILAFLLNYIPNAGAVVAVLVPLPVVLLDPSLMAAQRVLAIILPMVLHGLVGNFVEPLVFGDSLDLHPIIVLLTLAFWYSLWDIPGAILAVPMTAVLRICVSQFAEKSPYANAILLFLEGRWGEIAGDIRRSFFRTSTLPSKSGLNDGNTTDNSANQSTAVTGRASKNGNTTAAQETSISQSSPLGVSGTHSDHPGLEVTTDRTNFDEGALAMRMSSINQEQMQVARKAALKGGKEAAKSAARAFLKTPYYRNWSRAQLNNTEYSPMLALLCFMIHYRAQRDKSRKITMLENIACASSVVFTLMFVKAVAFQQRIDHAKMKPGGGGMSPLRPIGAMGRYLAMFLLIIINATV